MADDTDPDDFTSWHEWRPIIEEAPTKATKNVLIKAALTAPHVYRIDGMLIEGNDFGKAYSCMDEADMAIVLFRFCKQYGEGTEGKLKDAMKCLAVNLTEKAEGGLRTRKNGKSWYHGKTSRSSAALGGTLNKHLHAVRSFADAANTLDEIASGPTAEVYRKAAREGIRQLAGSGALTLQSFRYAKRSWFYYATDPNGGNGRWNGNGKDAGYHLYCMRLLSAINGRLPGVDWSGVPLYLLYDTYKIKLAEGLYTPSTPAPGGIFDALSASESPLDPDVIAFFESHP